MYRALIQRMQCEALDENKDGPSREEQSEQHSSADVPPRGPSKREAALAGAHKSPTKADGVVHKNARALGVARAPGGRPPLRGRAEDRD